MLKMTSMKKELKGTDTLECWDRGESFCRRWFWIEWLCIWKWTQCFLTFIIIIFSFFLFVFYSLLYLVFSPFNNSLCSHHRSMMIYSALLISPRFNCSFQVFCFPFRSCDNRFWQKRNSSRLKPVCDDLIIEFSAYIDFTHMFTDFFFPQNLRHWIIFDLNV